MADRSSAFLSICESFKKFTASTVATRKIFPEKKRTPVALRANQILQNIETLDKFLKDHHKQYVNTNKFLSSGSSSMTDKERDAIDTESKNFTKQCGQDIDALKGILGSNDAKKYYNTQSIMHLHNVIALLYYKLQLVAEFSSNQRSQRLKTAKLQDGFLKLPSVRKSTTIDTPSVDTETTHIEEELQLDEGEKRMLEEENLLLQNRLETTVDRAREIERKVMEISELHMIFATKVAEQEELANHIADNAVEAKHNVDKGTTELHKAARRGVDFRIFVLLFLIVASLALLFLHWIAN